MAARAGVQRGVGLLAVDNGIAWFKTFNGKDESCTQTNPREWVCTLAYRTSTQCAENKPRWLPLLQLAPAAPRFLEAKKAHQPNRPDRRQAVEIPLPETSRNHTLRQQA